MDWIELMGNPKVKYIDAKVAEILYKQKG